MKKITFASKPRTVMDPQTADQWVADQAAAEPTKRLTLDVSLSLHRRMKTQCAIDGLVMADVIRELLERRFPESRASTDASSRESVPS